MGMRMAAMKSAVAGNRAREEKWKQVMQNKAKLSDAALISANARKADVAQQKYLTRMREQGATNRTAMSNNTTLANTELAGRNTLANTELAGRNTLANTELAGRNSISLAEYNAQKDKEKDIRGLGLDAVRKGLNGPNVENLVNADGEFNASIGGINFPQEQKKFPPKFIPGEMGNPDRVYDPNTNTVLPVGGTANSGAGEKEGGALGLGAYAGYDSQMIRDEYGNGIMTNGEFNDEAEYINATKALANFDPNNASKEQRAYLEELYRRSPKTFERIMAKYRSAM